MTSTPVINQPVTTIEAGLRITRDNDGNPVYCTLHGKQLRYAGPGDKGQPIFCGTIELDPDFAKATLANMHTNRNLNKGHVEALCADMMNEAWQLTGETIIFDENGITTDSQHRQHAYLRACEILGRRLEGIRMTAVAGVSPSSMLVLDSGKKRTVVDAARIAQAHLRDEPQVAITSKHQEIIKAILPKLTASELVKLLQKFADPIEYVCIPGQKGKGCFCAYPSVRSQLFLACLEHRDSPKMLDKIEQFKYLLDGEYDRESFTNADSFVAKYGFSYSDTRAWPLVLRHEVEEAKRNKQYGGTARKESMIKGLKAIRAWLSDSPGPSYSDGRRQPLAAVASKDEFFNDDLRNMQAWNDNSFRSIFGGIVG